MISFGKLLVEIQQELNMASEEESSTEEIETYLMRNYQHQQFTAPPTTIHSFKAVTTTTPATKPTLAPTQPEGKKIEEQCFYCDKTGHRKIEYRAKQSVEANGIAKEDVTKTTRTSNPDKSKYNPKLVCQICGYTGHSVRDCRRRVPKESSSAYGNVPNSTNSQEDNKNRR